jgi:hypothetical protein
MTQAMSAEIEKMECELATMRQPSNRQLLPIIQAGTLPSPQSAMT